MNYEKKYKEALERARKFKNGEIERELEIGENIMEYVFPELKESEDEKIRKWLIGVIKSNEYGRISNVGYMPCPKPNVLAWLEKQGQVKDFAISQHENKKCKENGNSLTSEDERIKENIIATIHLYYGEPLEDEAEEMLAWLEKQCTKTMDCSQNHQDSNHPNGCIVLEDFNGGEGFYKVHLDYLSKKQIEEVEEMVRVWNHEESNTSNENANIQQKDFAPKVEPKFRVNDWITDGKALLCITKFEIDYGYELKAIDGEVLHFVSPDLVEAYYHHWSVQDAKDGDVLEFDCGVGIFKNLSSDGYNAHCYCYYDSNGQLETNDCSLYDIYEVTPATKEQRDTLMKAMSDAGYTFDFDKKELKKIEKNPAWSEEDIRMASAAKEFITICPNLMASHSVSKSSVIAWLKSLKGRVQPQPKQEWSEEDEVMFKSIIATCELAEQDRDSSPAKHLLEMQTNWLKSLRDKYAWKPSDEQMFALQYVYRNLNPPLSDNLGWNSLKTLELMYQDLKKLREE